MENTARLMKHRKKRCFKRCFFNIGTKNVEFDKTATRGGKYPPDLRIEVFDEDDGKPKKEIPRLKACINPSEFMRL